MAKDFIKQDLGRAWEGIPPYARLMLYGLGAYAVYKGAQYVFSYVGGAIDADAAKFKGQGYKATLSQAEYMNLASQIKAAKGYLNDDEAAVYSALMQLNNPVDFIELQKAFGIEEQFFGSDQDLLAFLRDMLNQDEKTKANNILAQRNIPYRI